MDVVNLTCDTLAILHGSSLLAVQVVNFNHIFWLVYVVFIGFLPAKSLSNRQFVFLVVFGWGLLVKSTSNRHSMRVLADFCGVSIVSIPPKAQRIPKAHLEVQEQLHSVVELSASSSAFSALRSDGQVVSWGDFLAGGRTCEEATGVVKVVGALEQILEDEP